MDRTIKAEVLTQVKLMKDQLDIEIQEDLKNLRTELLGEMRKMLKESTADIVEDSSARQQQQLAIVQNANKEMAQALYTGISKKVYTSVMADVNSKIIPKVRAMAEYMEYHTEDPSEIINNYRRAVHNQVNPSGGSNLLITGDGAKGSKAPKVETYFTENDEYL